MTAEKYQRKQKAKLTELKVEPVNYDVKASMIDLVRMFDLLRIKFENHIALTKKENNVSTSLTGIQQQFLKLFNSIEKFNV